MKSSIPFLLFLLVLIIALAIFESAIVFILGYFTGWLAEITIGDKLVEGLRVLFRTNYFTKDMLPTLAGGLAWVAAFFKSGGIVSGICNSTNKKIKEYQENNK